MIYEIEKLQYVKFNGFVGQYEIRNGSIISPTTSPMLILSLYMAESPTIQTKKLQQPPPQGAPFINKIKLTFQFFPHSAMPFLKMTLDGGFTARTKCLWA